jgi:hypothetical protein
MNLVQYENIAVGPSKGPLSSDAQLGGCFGAHAQGLSAAGIEGHLWKLHDEISNFESFVELRVPAQLIRLRCGHELDA